MIEIRSLKVNQELISLEFELSGEFRDEYTPMLVIFRALMESAYSVEPSIEDLAKSLSVCETAPTRWNLLTLGTIRPELGRSL